MYPILVIAAALMLLIPGVYQTPEPSDTYRAYVQVENASLTTLDDGSLGLRVEGDRGTGCDLPVTVDISRQGGTLTIELYEEVPNDLACTMMLITYDEVIPLDLDLDSPNLPGRIEVNDFTLLTDFAASAANVERFDHVIEEVALQVTVEEIENRPNYSYALIIRGTEATGCDPEATPGYNAVETIDYADGWITVEAYAELPAETACPRIARPYERTFELPEEFGEAFVSGDLNSFGLLVNDNAYIVAARELGPVDNDEQPEEFTFPAVPAERDPIAVTGVQVEETPDLDFLTQHALIVSGTLPNGCIFPVGHTVDFSGEEFTIEVYTLTPQTPVDCPAMLREVEVRVELGALTNGFYSYTVNEFFGSFNVTSQQETIRSLHVIQSVDVLVRESFPPQYVLQVRGYQPDGCMAAVQVTQRVGEGRTLYVEIFRTLPLAVMCPAVVEDYAENIVIEADLSDNPGTWTVFVNDYEVEIDVP
jgi:hypothetical protein